MTQIERWAQELAREAVAAEREACAKIAEEHKGCRASQLCGTECDAGNGIADAIRARVQQC